MLRTERKDDRPNARTILHERIGEAGSFAQTHIAPRNVHRAIEDRQGSATLLGMAGRFTQGVIHGFTTININRTEPANVAEGIAQSFGTWVGITGTFIPFIGKGAKAVGLGSRAIMRGGVRKTTGGTATRTAGAMGGTMGAGISAPIALGNMAVKASHAAQRQIMTPAGRRWAAKNRLFLDSVEGATRIGVAMGSLGWQEGVEGMLWGAGFGVLFGGTDRMIGNVVRQMRPQLQRYVKASQDMSRTPSERARSLAIAERTVSAISAGMISGMPSTIMGMPWEYQIYDYLFGAWLGAEPPYHRRRAHQMIDQVRAGGKQHLLMSKTMREELPEWRLMTRQHKNEKVRQGIIEEVEAQVDFRFGKLHGAWAEAFYVKAAALGNMTGEQVTEMRDSKFVRDVADQAYQSGLRQGMTEDQAQNHAIDYAREQYARWKQGEEVTGRDLNIIDQAEPFIPNAMGYRLYQAVEVTGADGNKVMGIVTSVTAKGTAMEITAMDGTKLVVPDGRDKSRIATQAEIASQRESLQHRYTQITRDQFEVMAANEDPASPYPRELWDRFPEVRDRHFVNEARAVEGGFRAVVRLGHQDVAQTAIHETQQTALQAGEQIIMEHQRQGTLKVINDLNDASDVMKALVNEGDDFESMVSVASIRELTRQVAREEGIDEAVATLQTYHKILQIAQSSQADTTPWTSFTRQLTEMYPKFGDKMAKNPDIMNAMRHWYKRSMSERPVQKMAMRDGELVKLGEHYHDGKRAHEMKAPSYMSRVLSRLLNTEQVLVFHIDRIETTARSKDRETRTSQTLHDHGIGESHFYQMTYQLATGKQTDRPYYLMGGVKDKDTLRGLPLLFGDHAAAMSYLTRRLKVMGEEFNADYQASKADFVAKMTEHTPAKAKSSENLFDMIFASEIRLMEAMNNDMPSRHRYAVKNMASKPGFLKNRAARNKRMQIMDAEGITADAEFFTGIKGVQRNRLKALIINTVNDDGSSHALGLEEYRLRNLDGKDDMDSPMARAHRDGVVLVRPDVYDAMARDSGMGTEGDALKGFTAFGDRHGMFLGKYAMFRATEKAAQFMDSQGTHLLYYTDSVKQKGDRSSYNMSVDKSGNTSLWRNKKGEAVKSPQTYAVPFDGITYNLGKGDKPAKALRDQILARQVLQQMMEPHFDSKIIKEEFNEILQYAMQTRPETSQLLSDIEQFHMLDMDPAVRDASLEKLRSRIEKLDVDTLGIKDLNTILDGEEAYVQTGLYEKVVRHIMDSPSQPDAWDRTMDVNSYMELLNNDYVASKDVIFDSMEGVMTPAITYSSGMRALFEQAKASYFVDRLVRPKVPYSMKSIGSGQDGWHLAKFGKLEVGTFMLGQGAKNMKVRVFNMDMTLGEAWDIYQGDRKRIADLQQIRKPTTEQATARKKLLDKVKQWEIELSMTVARVPIEHASGVRPLRFVGFSDDIGTTSKLHPEDMSYLGGMDLDIDDMFIYQNMGKKLRKGKDGKKTRLIDELNRPEIKRRWHDDEGNFRDPEENADWWEVTRDDDRSFAKMFAPNENFSLARTTVTGNENLGIIANAKRDIQAFISLFRGQPDGKHSENYTSKQFRRFMTAEFANIKDDASRGKVEFAFDKAMEGATDIRIAVKTDDATFAHIEALGRSGINLSADASNYLSFKPAGDITRDFLNEVIVVEKKVGGEWVLLEWTMNTTPVFSKMKQASRHVDLRRDDGRRMRYSEMALGIRKVENDFRALTKVGMGRELSLNDIPGSFYSSAYMLSHVHANYEPFSGTVMSRLEQMYTVYNNITSAQDMVGRLIRDFTGGRRGQQSEKLKYGERRIRKVTKENFVKAVEDYRTAMKNPALTIQQRQAHIDKMYDFLANDLHAMNSAISLYREGARLVRTHTGENALLSDGTKFEAAMLANIANQVSVYKWNMVNLQAEKTAIDQQSLNEVRQLAYWREYKSIEALRMGIADYRASLPKELRRYHDFFAMGAFTTQNATYKFMKNNPFYAHIPREHSRDFYANYQALTRLQADSANEQAYREAIQGDVDFRHMVYNENSGMSTKPTPIQHRLSQIKPAKEGGIKAVEDDLARIAEESPEYRTFLDNVIKANQSRKFAFDSEQKQMVADLQQLFKNHPHLRQYFDTLFAGEISMATGLEGPRPEMATMEDLRTFLGIMKGYRHGNLLGEGGQLPSSLPKFLWWMMPNRYHEHVAPFDNALVHTYGPVLTAPGKVVKGPMSMITSTPSRLNKMGTAMDQAIQWQVRERSERFFTDHKPFEDALGKDHDLIWDYVVLMREARNPETFSSNSRKRFDEAEKKMRKEINQDRNYKINEKEVTLEQAIEQVDQFITKKNQEIWADLVQGKHSEKYRIVKDTMTDMETGEVFEILDTQAIITMLQKNLQQGDPSKVELVGIDLMQQVAWQYAAENRFLWNNPTTTRNSSKFDEFLYRLVVYTPYKNLTPMNPEAYYPHFQFDNKGMQTIIAKRWKQMMEHGYTKEEAREHLAQEVFNGDPSDPASNAHMNETLDMLLSLADRGVDEAAVNRLRSSELPGSLRHRDRVDPITGRGDQIDGWQTDITAYLSYTDNIISHSFRKMMALAGAKEINDFEGRLVQEKKATMAANTRHPWADFMRLYVRDVVGTTTELPASWLEGYKELGIKRSGYKYFTDSHYRKLDLRISKMLDTAPLLAENNPMRPFRLVSLANMEAKYSLMTLLSRPKAAATNLFGGNQLAQIDLGWKNFFRGYNLKALQQLDPEKRNWSDWVRFAEQHGAMETLIRNEIMATPAYRDVRYRKGFEQMMLKLKQDPAASDETLWAIGRKYGLTNAIMDTAALPMRFSERILRSRTFLGHLLKATDVMEKTGPRAHEDPWVLEMARRGTVSAQFLYNASNRPAFARTNAGKIMTRFKMWAFNSVQFRNLARQQAAEMGYREGTPAYDRFQRMITSDALLFGLAMLFPFTLFDTAIPEPYGWMKDLVSWAFGDSQDRETAFFGALPGAIAPANIALPPSSRVITTWATPLMTGDWDGFLGYHVWSLFPFGLLARDIKRTAEDPRKAPRRLTGLPLDQLKNTLPTPFGSLNTEGVAFE